MVHPNHRKTVTRETPFMLTNSSWAVFFVEVALFRLRLTTFQESLNNTALQEALDVLPFV